jgi:hypothetical protein
MQEMAFAKRELDEMKPYETIVLACTTRYHPVVYARNSGPSIWVA